MRMNRRNVLVGLGTIVAGGGAALGTGAFSSVEADRTVSVGVAEDSSALLGLEPGNSEFVEETNGIISIDISNVNLEAKTTISDVITIKNNSGNAGGSQDISVSANITEYGADVGESSAFSTGEVDGIVSLETSGGTDITTESVTIQDTNSETISLVIDTTGYDASDFTDDADLVNQVTLTADGQQST